MMSFRTSAREELLRAVRLDGARKPRERMHVGGAAQGDAFVLGKRPDGIPFPLHHRLQPRMHVVDGPVVALPVLHPLEVRNGDTARVRQDVRKNDDVPGLEDLVGLGRERAIGKFENDASLYAGSIAFMDHVLQRRRNEQFAVDRNEIVGRKSGDAI